MKAIATATKRTGRKTSKVIINGFGRIGRKVLRAAVNRGKLGNDFIVLGINDPGMSLGQAQQLLEHDSVFGKFRGDVSTKEKEGKNYLLVNGEEIEFTSIRDPRELELNRYKIDDLQLIECSGVFRGKNKSGDREADMFLDSGARKVILSAPSGEADATIVYGVNHWVIDSESIHDFDVISNASCTTNSLAPVIRVLQYGAFDDNGKFMFVDRGLSRCIDSAPAGIRSGIIFTVHSYTSDQRLLDAPHKDFKRMWAAGRNMLVTSTGAAQAIGRVMPALAFGETSRDEQVKRLDGLAIRVPLEDVSVTVCSLNLKRKKTREELIELFKLASEHPELKGILKVVGQTVSSQILGDSYSSIIESYGIKVVEGGLVSVFAWYDNETGYANRIIDLVEHVNRYI